MDKYFLTYSSSEYRFMNREIRERHRNLTTRPVGEVVLHEIIELARTGGIQVPIKVRSVYRPEMLIKPCRKFESGGKMSNYSRKDLSQAFHRVKRKFRLREKVAPLPLEAVAFDGSKNSGLPYLTRKEEVYPQTLLRAKRVMNGECLPPPMVMFHRGKNTEVARPVFALPFEEHLIEGRFFYPLQEQWNLGVFPYCAGVRPGVVGMRVNDMKTGTHVLGFDYSGFDGSISSKLIHMAFDIIKSNIEMSDTDEKVFNHVVCYFCTSAIVAPDGCVYKGRRHGVPSGSMFTQMVDSLVNAIVIEYSALRLGVSGLRYLVLGDDSIVAFDSGTTDMSQWSQMMRELGITMSPDKSENFEGKNIHFLGHEWERGIPGRTIEESLSKLACPERVRREYFSKDRRKAIIERVEAYVDENGATEPNHVLRKMVWCLGHGGDLVNPEPNYWIPGYDQKDLTISEFCTGRAQYDEEHRQLLKRNVSRSIKPAILL